MGANKEHYQAVDTEDESEETLSFCDLPIYGDDMSWEDFSKDYQSSNFSSSSSSEQDYFEFFSEEWTSSSTSSSISYPPENIVFCGKLISHKQPKTSEQNNKPPKNMDTHKRKGLFWRNSGSFFNSKTLRSSSLRVQLKNKNESKLPYTPSSKSLSVPESEKHDFPVEKVSIWRSSSRSRWYLFIFGLSSYRLPKEMELSDIRSRQSRRSPKSAMSPSGGGGEKVMNPVGGWIQKRLWGLIRVLGCGGGGGFHPNAFVTASFGGTP